MNNQQTHGTRCHDHLVDRIRGAVLPLFQVAVVCWIVGCGGSDAETASPVVPSNAETAGNSAVTNADGAGNAQAASAEKKNRRRDEVWVDESGQKWFGNVPMDAFFDQPYAVTADQTSVNGATSVANIAPVESESTGGSMGTAMSPPVVTPDPAMAMTDTEPALSPATSGNSGSGDDWTVLMPGALLDEESKSIRSFLRENLQSVGNYNSSMLMIPPKAATLAVLAGIAMEHPEKVTWKDDARYIRDLAKQMNASALQRGARDQKRLSQLFEAISDTMDRSKPAGLAEPPESDGFAETAEMRLLMNRMEECEKRLKTEAGTEGAMNSRKEMVMLEASILGSLANVITKPGYGYEDDDEFKAFAKDIMSASLTMKTAAESGDFSGFEAAVTKVSTSCTNCHSQYRSE